MVHLILINQGEARGPWCCGDSPGPPGGSPHTRAPAAQTRRGPRTVPILRGHFALAFLPGVLSTPGLPVLSPLSARAQAGPAHLPSSSCSLSLFIFFSSSFSLGGKKKKKKKRPSHLYSGEFDDEAEVGWEAKGREGGAHTDPFSVVFFP